MNIGDCVFNVIECKEWYPNVKKVFKIDLKHDKRYQTIRQLYART